MGNAEALAARAAIVRVAVVNFMVTSRRNWRDS
jgi:hypothetical protein